VAHRLAKHLQRHCPAAAPPSPKTAALRTQGPFAAELRMCSPEAKGGSFSLPTQLNQTLAATLSVTGKA
jgi:hypothetical protein